MIEPLTERPLLTEVEQVLKNKFVKDSHRRMPSSAAAWRSSERVDQLVLPDEMRAKMPFTKDKFLVRENPRMVSWERELRKFLRRLSPEHGHRISATMVYEWATGIQVAELMAEGGNANSEMRMLNKIMRYYFGKAYMTYIMGRKVPNCYRVKPGYYIVRHRPFTLTLYAEYCEGTLYP